MVNSMRKKIKFFNFREGKFVVVAILAIAILFLGNTADAKLKIDDEKLKEIKTALEITNFPILFDYTDKELKEILNTIIKPEESEITYGILITGAFNEMEFMDAILSQAFLDRNRAYFNSVLDKRIDLFNHWRKTGRNMYKLWQKGKSATPFTALALESVEIINKTMAIFDAFKVLEDTRKYKGLWRYFDERRNGESHESAWELAEAQMGWAVNAISFRRGAERKDEVRQVEQQLTALYEKWGSCATAGGISDWCKKQLAGEIRNTLAVALESHTFVKEEPRPPLLSRLTQQFGNMKNALAALVSKINPFNRGEPAVEVRPQQDQDEEKDDQVEKDLAKIIGRLDNISNRVDAMDRKIAQTAKASETSGELVDFVKGWFQQFQTETTTTEDVENLDGFEEEKIEEESQEEIEDFFTTTTSPIILCQSPVNDHPTRYRILINEVAWMGSQNSSNDEFIELKNIWGIPVNLAGWQLLDKDQQIKVIFSKNDIISANGFYLLERTDDDSAPNVPADLIYKGTLNNTNEALYLFNNNCQLEDQVLADPDWPAGDSEEKRTMERFDAVNWYTGISGGTPKRENSSPPSQIADFSLTPPPTSSSSASPPPEEIEPELESEPAPEPESEPEEPLLTVVINEIAWAGTEANSADEWLELYNHTSSEVDLNNWTLNWSHGTTTHSLVFSTSTGSTTIISAHSFYLLERSDDQTISDILAGQFFTGALNNNSGKLELRNASNNLIDIVDCSDGWFAGKSENRISMERINPLSVSDTDNWVSNNRITQNGQDAAGNRINGTPKAENSVSKEFTDTNGFNINDNFTLSSFGSPYIVNGFINVLPTGKLTLKPGVEIQFQRKSGINIEGELEAASTTFTAFNENQPWDWIYFKQGSEGKLENIIAEKGGQLPCPGFNPACTFNTGKEAIVQAEEAEIEIKNSVIKNSDTRGLWAKNTKAVIQNTQFLNNGNDDYTKGYMAAIHLEGDDSEAIIENSTFQNNDTGIWIAGPIDFLVKNNTFTNNITPIKTSSLDGEFSGNSAQNNNINGILVTNLGFYPEVNQIEWNSANLSYVLGGGIYQIPFQKTLTIEASTTIKFKTGGGLKVEGTLKAEGQNDKKIVFTAFNDDQFLGDTNNDGSSIGTPGYWDYIYLSDSSPDSVLDNVIVCYGGYKGSGDNFKGAITAENVSITISNSIIENNLVAGVQLINSTSTIKNTTFRNYPKKIPSGGWLEYSALYLENSNPILIDNHFEDEEDESHCDIFIRENCQCLSVDTYMSQF